MARGRLFINYRRDDSRADSGRVYDRLAACFPRRVFRDIASLEPGMEWDTAIARVLAQSDACIIVIGKTWVSMTDASGRRRLDDPRDTVRQEIVMAMQRQMRIFPVLVGGAHMPSDDELPPDLRPLCRYHAIELGEQDWDEDVRKLVKALESVLGPALDPGAHQQPFYRKVWFLAGSGALAAVIVLGIYGASIQQRQGGASPPAEQRTLAVVPQQQAAAAPPQQTTAAPERQEAPAPTRSEPAPAPHVTYQPAYPDHSQLPGAWHAQVSQMPDQTVELFPDHSFRVVLQQATSGVGRWRYNSGTLYLTDATNFLNGLKFECAWAAVGAGAGFSGNCRDTAQITWFVSLTRGGRTTAEETFETPRIDVTSLTTAERAAFAEYLAGQPCTCGCGLTLLVCLRKDLTCNFSPNLARMAMATFLRLTR